LKHYKKHFKDKVVYCNCDDPRISNFFHYFSYNFEKLGLKSVAQLIEYDKKFVIIGHQNAISYNENGKALELMSLIYKW